MTFDPADAWGQVEAEARASSVAGSGFRYYRPFSSAVDDFVAEAQDGERIYLGIPEYDQQMRGIGRGHLCAIVGYSHSGKTLLLTHILEHNRDKRVALFIPDEPSQLVLAKLTSLLEGVPADEIEERVAHGDVSAIELLRRTAEEQFPNLVVFDKPVTSNDMDAAIREAEQVWGDKCQLVVLDYLQLLGAGETVEQKFEFMKGICSRHELASIVIHQTSRAAGAEGRRMTISSGAFGGEAFATFQIGVWRKRSAVEAELLELEDKIARAANGATEKQLEQRDRLRAEYERTKYTISTNLNKNKRPGRREGRDEIDFELFLDTGRIVALGPTDLPEQYLEEIRNSRQAHVQAEHTYDTEPEHEPTWTEQVLDPSLYPDEEPF